VRRQGPDAPEIVSRPNDTISKLLCDLDIEQFQNLINCSYDGLGTLIYYLYSFATKGSGKPPVLPLARKISAISGMPFLFQKA
jgi:hypothetical protein